MQNISPQYHKIILNSLKQILLLNDQNEQDILIRDGNTAENRQTEISPQQEQISQTSSKNIFCQKNTVNDIPIARQSQVPMNNFQMIMKNNQMWSNQHLQQDPEYFSRHLNIQKPQYLWIGCSDSRVSANEISGLKPGQLFVHRNIANQVPLSDVNCLSIIQFSVQVLKIKDIVVCGHYGCDGIKAAFQNQDYGALECWLSFIRDLRARYRNQFKKHSDQENQQLLVELNVKQQVLNIARQPSVQKAWKNGQELRIHGLVYRLQDGLLENLKLTVSSADQLPEQFKIY